MTDGGVKFEYGIAYVLALMARPHSLDLYPSSNRLSTLTVCVEIGFINFATKGSRKRCRVNAGSVQIELKKILQL